jgi:serine/threonine protein kinase
MDETQGQEPAADKYDSSVPAMSMQSDDATPQLLRDAPTIPPDALPAVLPHDDPSTIGRYRVIRKLGQGGFGRVYLAHDDELHRSVAIKLPTPERISRPQDIEAYLSEARVLASLDHPHIVPVYDVGRTDDGHCYIVSKFVEGNDLANLMRTTRLSCEQAAELVATVAEALHYAHTRKLVHRDIKPGNILIDTAGRPHVVDFGLALKEEDFGKGAHFAGTPAYMSPEQAREEGHRVDGRSDIFSLGVVLYRLVTGRLPFHGDTIQLLDQICFVETRPPRQIDDEIPKELERICLKALSKRLTERYSTAKDMAEDLHHFVAKAPVTALALASAPGRTPSPTEIAAPPPITPVPSDSDRAVKVIPKGLRSFDAHDSDFFLELLPGPRDRDGLPDSIRFWKSRIDETDPDMTFHVGLIYGPSGCGKSSLVKAGLLPRLAHRVLTIYVEATAEETEPRLLKNLRKHCPGLPSGLGLVDSMVALRRGGVLPTGKKVLLVLDQFEQWLHAKRGEENTELVAALRHCDGEHVQALVTVRDDFWMAATRFMRGLETRLVEGENSAAVDLFDLDHARKVLVAFGRAFGKLPEKASDISKDQKDFLKESVNGLAEDGKIISVRLALFAEMLKTKPWTPATLREVGGTRGVGLTFLDETFSASTAPPVHRFHQKAAQAVLKALLPESGTDIKGQMRSRQELLEASGYAKRSKDFDDLIHILDPELRLITPTDPEGSDDDLTTTDSRQRYYQLTHDYLVHSLRNWLTRKQRQTRRGRTEIRLAEAAKLWGANPKMQSLPGFSEWLAILLLTRRAKWSPLERRMLHAAARKHRAGLLFALFVIALSCLLPVLGSQYIRATLLADEFRMGLNDLAVIDNMSSCRFWIDPILESKLADAKKDKDPKWVVRYSAALLPTHPDMRDTLYSEVFTNKIDTGIGPFYGDPNLAVTMLKKYDPGFATRMWEIAADKTREIFCRYFAASMLIETDPSNARWSDLAGDLIDANFASKNQLSFRQFSSFEIGRGPFRLDAGLKEHFRKALLRKIDRCSESYCPWAILTDFFTHDEAIDIVVDGYLKGHFSFNSLIDTSLHVPRTASRVKALLVKQRSDPGEESRRDLALKSLNRVPG